MSSVGAPLDQDVDPRGHAIGCPQFSLDPLPDEGTHRDMFCDCHHWDEPRILANGTDVAWPPGWNNQQAAAWRARNDLAPPSEPGSGP